MSITSNLNLKISCTVSYVKTKYCYLHLFIPTLEDPANHGSRINMQRNVLAPTSPARKLGLSCNRRPLRNQ